MLRVLKGGRWLMEEQHLIAALVLAAHLHHTLQAQAAHCPRPWPPVQQHDAPSECDTPAVVGAAQALLQTNHVPEDCLNKLQRHNVHLNEQSVCADAALTECNAAQTRPELGPSLGCQHVASPSAFCV